jgi:hypothetical protein
MVYALQMAEVNQNARSSETTLTANATRQKMFRINSLELKIPLNGTEIKIAFSASPAHLRRRPIG